MTRVPISADAGATVRYFDPATGGMRAGVVEHVYTRGEKRGSYKVRPCTTLDERAVTVERVYAVPGAPAAPAAPAVVHYAPTLFP